MSAAYYANGKLLLTGEYTILYGATGIALPINKGQFLTFYRRNKAKETSRIVWKANDYEGKDWFQCILNKDNYEILEGQEIDKMLTLITLLKNLNPAFWQYDEDYFFETKLTFNNNWGFGTSSTLVSLLAQCSNSNPYTLYDLTFKGSGYDLACATAKTPILYQRINKKPHVTPIVFNPTFKDKIYFAYLGQKANSLKSITNKPVPTKELIDSIDKINQDILNKTDDFEGFKNLIMEHEQLIGNYLGKAPIGNRFSDTALVFKSLGAWGGDFVMVLGDKKNIDQLKLSPIFSWDELILKG